MIFLHTFFVWLSSQDSDFKPLAQGFATSHIFLESRKEQVLSQILYECWPSKKEWNSKAIILFPFYTKYVICPNYNFKHLGFSLLFNFCISSELARKYFAISHLSIKKTDARGANKKILIKTDKAFELKHIYGFFFIVKI